MNILFLAPQPFYEERGTPIAVDRVLRVLSARGEHVDVVTYQQGTNVQYPGVRIHRTRKLPFAQRVRPGFSWKKVAYDLAMLPVITRLLISKRYNLVHAVEESVFIALALKILFRIPYVYDMDSSLSQQIGEKYPAARPLTSLLGAFENLAIHHASATLPVCEALATHIQRAHPGRVLILPDVSLLQPVDHTKIEDLRSEFGIRGALLLYVGNLETYQGIDLLLESFQLASQQAPDAALVIIGGENADIARYKSISDSLGLAGKVHFCGPRPVEHLAGYLSQADILVSPRVKGTNTPMKVYSYLDSGKALLATDLPTHTQVLNQRVAMLAQPVPVPFAQALVTLLSDPVLRQRLGDAGHQLVRDEYSPMAFQQKLNGIYDYLREETQQARKPLEAVTR